MHRAVGRRAQAGKYTVLHPVYGRSFRIRDQPIGRRSRFLVTVMDGLWDRMVRSIVMTVRCGHSTRIPEAMIGMELLWSAPLTAGWWAKTEASGGGMARVGTRSLHRQRKILSRFSLLTLMTAGRSDATERSFVGTGRHGAVSFPPPTMIFLMS